MTLPTPPEHWLDIAHAASPPARATPPDAARPPLLARLKLTEPVRLYMYTVLLVIEGGLVLAGWLTGEWQDYLATSGALLLAVPAGAEASRSSVYSTRSVVQAVRRAANR